MTLAQIRERDVDRLMTVHPELRLKIQNIIRAMSQLGFEIFVASAVRTDAEQFELYKKGRKLIDGQWVPVDPIRKTGIVTDKNGTTNRSNHQTKEDGFGHAVDLVFLIDGPDQDHDLDTPSWDERHPWDLMGLMGEKLGLTWGGRWKVPHDMPHLEQRT